MLPLALVSRGNGAQLRAALDFGRLISHGGSFLAGLRQLAPDYLNLDIPTPQTRLQRVDRLEPRLL